MRVKSVTCEIGRTINTGNYENVRPAGAATVELDDGDDINKAIQMARKYAIIAFKQSVDDIVVIKDAKMKVREVVSKEAIEKLLAVIEEDLA